MKHKIEPADQTLLDSIAQIIYDKKGSTILALDVRKYSSLTEYFVFAEGNVERHVAAIARALIDEKSGLNLKPYNKQGLGTGDWVVIDFGHIIVHLMTQEVRETYNLELIWKAGSIVDLNIRLENKSHE
jgi:ribosome-associated protein